MKIEIEITPEEFKELYTPGQTQQEFFTQFWTEFNKNVTTAFTDQYTNMISPSKKNK